jgi:mannose-6-phosphate isomerase
VAGVYPLIFEPIFKPKLWGGRRLQVQLGKRLPGHEPIGESWEIADLDDDRVTVANGPWKGKTLSDTLKDWGAELTGRAELIEGRFPLLLKFLDAADTLSIQVHPTAAVATRLRGRVRVKHEAWYVVDADTMGFIYRGFKPGVDANLILNALRNGDLESLLLRIPVRKGHCYYLPSGTVHALGAGVLVAEVQTPSDTTYRLYDWDRVDPATGHKRDLHIDEAIECIDFDPPIADAERKQHVASVWTAVTSLVRCDAFVLERVRMVEGVEQPIPYAEMVIWMVLEGGGEIIYDGPASPTTFRAGDTMLLPAALKNGRVKTSTASMWLEITLPIKSSLAGFDRPPREGMAPPPEGSPFVPLNVPRP